MTKHMKDSRDPFVSPSTRVEAGELVERLSALKARVQEWTAELTSAPKKLKTSFHTVSKSVRDLSRWFNTPENQAVSIYVSLLRHAGISSMKGDRQGRM